MEGRLVTCSRGLRYLLAGVHRSLCRGVRHGRGTGSVEEPVRMTVNTNPFLGEGRINLDVIKAKMVSGINSGAL